MTSPTWNSSSTSLLNVSERSLEAILSPYCATSSPRPPRLSESQIRQISTSLNAIGKESWSRVPRIYAVLHMVKNVQVIDSFLSEGVSDLWFPFSHKTLPDSLRSQSARFEFLELQDLVLTKALDLERDNGRHRHFSKSDEIPLQKVEELGKGGFGFVDRVVSTITYKEYARKLIPRGKTFKKNIEVLRSFEQELSNLKKLSHPHIVELVGSYTDSRFVGILMAPVADYNLHDFLHRENLPAGDKSFLRTFYGCLVAGLCYIHENRFRHKDIKPQNVLVKGHHVFLTDFGISLDWSDLGQSTTTGVTVRTPRYAAPEVAEYMPRNTSADIWSLGCVFLEIWTVLKGETIPNLFKFMGESGSKSTCYYLNQNAVSNWCNGLLSQGQTLTENPPIHWIQGALQADQDLRWTAQKLAEAIAEVNDDPEQRYAFSGMCCIDFDDSTDSHTSSKRSSRMLDVTTASSIEVYQPSSISSASLVKCVPVTDSESVSLTLKPSETPSKTSEERLAVTGDQIPEPSEVSSIVHNDDDDQAAMISLPSPEEQTPSRRLDNTVTKPVDISENHMVSPMVKVDVASEVPSMQPESSSDKDVPTTSPRQRNLITSQLQSFPDDGGRPTVEGLHNSTTIQTNLADESVSIEDPLKFSLPDAWETAKLEQAIAPNLERVADQDSGQDIGWIREVLTFTAKRDGQTMSEYIQNLRAKPKSYQSSEITELNNEFNTRISFADLAKLEADIPAVDTVDAEQCLASNSSERASPDPSLQNQYDGTGTDKDLRRPFSFEELPNAKSTINSSMDQPGTKKSEGSEAFDSLHNAIQESVPMSRSASDEWRDWRAVQREFNTKHGFQDSSPPTLRTDTSDQLTPRSTRDLPVTVATQEQSSSTYGKSSNSTGLHGFSHDGQLQVITGTDSSQPLSRSNDSRDIPPPAPTEPHFPELPWPSIEGTSTSGENNLTQGFGSIKRRRSNRRKQVNQTELNEQQQTQTTEPTIIEQSAVKQLTIAQKDTSLAKEETVSEVNRSVESGIKFCSKCRQQMTGQYVRALDGMYHLNCFRCLDCDKKVASKFFPVDKEDGTGQAPLCEKDYFSRLDLLCHHCSGPLPGSYITALGRKYHIEHFSCEMCDLVFGAQDSYYEHDGRVFCHYHYSACFAQRCEGCQTAIIKQFVEIFRQGKTQHWHPECYMIHKFWNVRLASSKFNDEQDNRSLYIEKIGNPTEAERIERSEREQFIEAQVYQIWTVLSTFEERCAATISDMLLEASNGNLGAGFQQNAELFIVEIQVLFESVQLHRELSLGNKEPNPTREAKLLCKKFVGLLTLMTKLSSRPKPGVTQDLLSLVTGLAHYLKLIIRIGLQYALKTEQEYEQSMCLTKYLSILDVTRLDSITKSSSIDWKLLAHVDSDACDECKEPIEGECLKSEAKQFHMQCLECYRHIHGFPPQPGWQVISNRSVLCGTCGQVNGNFRYVTQFEQYICLLRVALARYKEIANVSQDTSRPISSYEDTLATARRLRRPTLPNRDRITELDKDGQPMSGSSVDPVQELNYLTLDDIPRLVAAEQAKESAATTSRPLSTDPENSDVYVPTEESPKRAYASTIPRRPLTPKKDNLVKDGISRFKSKFGFR